MKKFLVVFVVLAMVCLSSMAFAVDVSVGGSVQVRSRNFEALNFDKDSSAGSQVDTQERIELDVNVKAGDDVKGKIALWNDFESWGGKGSTAGTSGGLENPQGNGFGNSTSNNGTFGFREAWINFNLPGVPLNVTAGHQLLALGNGWWFRSKHFGSDAWVVANVTGANTAAFVDVKAAEGNVGNSDDVDAYVLLDVYKFNDNNVAGIDVTYVDVRNADPATGGFPFDGIANARGAQLTNISLNYNGKIGPVALHAQGDYQTGKLKRAGIGSEPEFKGNQIVIQGNWALDPVTINFTFARGSGLKKGSNDVDAYLPILDIDPHYTFLYEYKTVTACGTGAAHTGFCNTTAYSVGASMDVMKNLNVGLDVWYLQASEKSGTPEALNTNDSSSDVGTEIDLTAKWKLYDNLSWNWNFGYFKPGDAMKTATTGPGSKTDAVLGAQGILSLNF